MTILRRLKIGILATSLGLTTACASANNYEIGGNTVVPTMKGRVQVNRFKGRSFRVQVDLENVEKLESPKAIVLWLDFPDKFAQKTSVLKYDNKTRHTVTNVTVRRIPTRVRVTIENDNSANTPSNIVLVSQPIEPE